MTFSHLFWRKLNRCKNNPWPLYLSSWWLDSKIINANESWATIHVDKSLNLSTQPFSLRQLENIYAGNLETKFKHFPKHILFDFMIASFHMKVHNSKVYISIAFWTLPSCWYVEKTTRHDHVEYLCWIELTNTTPSRQGVRCLFATYPCVAYQKIHVLKK